MQTKATIRLNTASQVFNYIKELVAEGEDVSKLFRHAIIQPLNYYESRIKETSPEIAGIDVFGQEPESSGSEALDAGIAALVEFISEKDGWNPPEWIQKPNRYMDLGQEWVVPKGSYGKLLALKESPNAFRKRGIFITPDALLSV